MQRKSITVVGIQRPDVHKYVLVAKKEENCVTDNIKDINFNYLTFSITIDDTFLLYFMTLHETFITTASTFYHSLPLLHVFRLVNCKSQVQRW